MLGLVIECSSSCPNHLEMLGMVVPILMSQIPADICGQEFIVKMEADSGTYNLLLTSDNCILHFYLVFEF